jgi:membrane protein required for colicin V production
MNWLDWIFILALLISIAHGFREGFVRMGIGFLALIVGFFCASWSGGMVAGFILPYVGSRPVAAIAGYLIVFFGVLIAGSLVAALLTRMLKIIGLSWADRLLGGACGLIRGFIVIVIIAMVFTAFAPKSLPRATEESTLAPYVLGGARALAAATPFEIRDNFERAYRDLKGLWKEALRRKPGSKHIEVRNE